MRRYARGVSDRASRFAASRWAVQHGVIATVCVRVSAGRPTRDHDRSGPLREAFRRQPHGWAERGCGEAAARATSLLGANDIRFSRLMAWREAPASRRMGRRRPDDAARHIIVSPPAPLRLCRLLFPATTFVRFASAPSAHASPAQSMRGRNSTSNGVGYTEQPRTSQHRRALGPSECACYAALTGV